MNKNKIIKITGIIVFLTIFFFIAFSINKDYISSFDMYVYDLSQKINTPFTTTLFKIITSLSGVSFVCFALVLCLIFIKDKHKRNTVLLIAFLVVLLNQIVKIIIARPRPEDIMLITEVGYSFPSAHAMFSFAFYGVLLYYLINSKMSKKWKIIVGILLTLLIITIPITRIYLGVHFASDVIAGISLSAAILLIYSLFSEKKS